MLATARESGSTWLCLGALLLASAFVEAFPVPIKGVRAGRNLAGGDLHRRDRLPVRLGGCRRARRDHAWSDRADSAAPLAEGHLQHRRLRDLGRGRRRDRAATSTGTSSVGWFALEIIAAAAHLLRPQRRARRARRQHRVRVRSLGADRRADGRVDARRVRDDGVGCDHALRPLAALAAARRRRSSVHSSRSRSTSGRCFARSRRWSSR